MSELALYLPGIFAAYSILVVGASSPGPAVAMLLGISTTQGRSAALIASFGIATGSMTINALTMLGIGLLLAEAAGVMTLMRQRRLINYSQASTKMRLMTLASK